VGMDFEGFHHVLCANCITEVLFEFGKIKKQTIDITQLLSSITVIYMDIDFELQLQIKQLHAEPLLIEQILINLINNSRQAIKQKK
jgi:signal transduction histidine kinase